MSNQTSDLWVDGGRGAAQLLLLQGFLGLMDVVLDVVHRGEVAQVVPLRNLLRLEHLTLHKFPETDREIERFSMKIDNEGESRGMGVGGETEG